MFLNWFKGVNRLIAIWVLLSVFILICNSFFYINDFVSSPQHQHFDHFDEVSNVVKAQGKTSLTLYYSYFVIDVFWAISLLLIIGFFAKDAKGISLIKVRKSKTPASYFFLIFAIAAFVFDVIEGILYSSFKSDFLEEIYYCKMASYAACLCFLLYWLLKTYILPHLKSILRFIGTAFLSILFIIVIYLLVTVMPQGGTLIVDLFYHPWNIIIFFFLLTFLALVISHYPSYVDIWLHADNTCVRLEMAKKFRLWGFGTIYYNTLNTKSEKNEIYKNAYVKAFRRSLGILLYVAVFKIFLDVIPRFFEIQFNVSTVTLLILVVALFIYYLEGEKYIYWKEILSGKVPSTSEKKKKVIDQIVTYVTAFFPYFIFCTFLVFITALVTYLTEWNKWSLLLFLITLGCQMFLYIHFKISRTYFKYVYYSDKLFERKREMFNPTTCITFDKLDSVKANGDSVVYGFLAALSDNVRYLNLMRLSGVLSLLTIITANCSYTVATFLNPLNIILLYINFFYSLITITFKHVLYYHRLEKEDTERLTISINMVSH